MNCVNESSPEYKKYLDSGIDNRLLLNIIIKQYQKRNNTDAFPSVNHVMKIMRPEVAPAEIVEVKPTVEVQEKTEAQKRQPPHKAKLSEYVNEIINQTTNPNLKRLAKKMLLFLDKNNVEVEYTSIEDDNKEGVLLGRYDSTRNVIEINRDVEMSTEQMIEVVLHEAIHAFTISTLRKQNPTQKEIDFRNAADKYYNMFIAAARRELGLTEEQLKDKYNGFLNKEEFVAELLTDKDFYNLLKKLEKSDPEKLFNALIRVIRLIANYISSGGINIYNEEMRGSLDPYVEYLVDFMQKDFVYEYTPGFNANKKSVKVDHVKLIKEDNEKAGLKLTADESSYTDSSGNLFSRLTDFVTTNFNNRYAIDKTLSPKELTQKIAEGQAKSDWKKAEDSSDDFTGTINFPVLNHETGLTEVKVVSYPDLVEIKRQDIEAGRMYGKLVHKVIEIRIARDKNDDYLAKKLLDEATEIVKGKPGLYPPLNPSSVNWILSDDFTRAFNDAGIQFFRRIQENADVMESELSVFSNKFNVATTIDGLIKHSDGYYTLLDFKSGKRFLNDPNEAVLLKYAQSLYGDVFDTKLSKAKLELAFRALLLKEKYGDIKFRDIRVIHLADQEFNIFDVDQLQTYMTIIERFYKETNPELHKELKERNLFNADLYKAPSKSFSELLTENTLTKEQKLAKLKQELETLMLSYPEAKRSYSIREKIVQLTKDINDLEFGVLNVEDDKLDMGLFKRYLGTITDSFNPILQRFSVAFYKAEDKINKEEAEVNKLHNSAYFELEKEYYRKFPQKKLLNKGVAGGIVWTTKDLNGQGIFDFMWEKKNKAGDYGNYFKPLSKILADPSLSAAQKNYAKMFRENIEKHYNETMLRKITIKKTFKVSEDGKYTKKTKNVEMTIAKALGYPETLPEDFTPRLLTTVEELSQREKVGILDKKTRDFYYKQRFQTFLEKEMLPKDQKNLGIPVKYMGQSPYLINNELHTFNPEIILKQFTSSMIKKKYKDELLHLGNGIVQYYRLKGLEEHEDEEFYKNTMEFISDHLIGQVMDTNKETSFTRKNIRIFNKTANVEKVMLAGKDYVSATSMWLQVPNGIANTALITILNRKESLKGSLAKRLGVEESAIDFTFKDLNFADAQIGVLMKDMMLGNLNKNKLWLLARELKYLPDNYDYKGIKDQLSSARNKALDDKYLYFAHSLGETYGQLVLLAAQMKHMGLYDKYEVEEVKNEQGEVVYNELVWKGGVRFKTVDGREITGISPEETMRIKKVSQRIHGGYRKEERTAMELTALGKWALQFKKYIPSILNNMFQQKGEDFSLGYWKKFPEQQDGEDVYQWVGRVNEGRVWTVINVLLNYARLSKNTEYNWANLQGEQKKNLIEAALTATFVMTLLMARGAFFDDDDEETQLYKKYSRLMEDITQGWLPSDLLRNFQTQTAVLPKTFDIMQAWTTFVYDGIIKGEETQQGRTKGLIQVFRTTPALNAGWQWDKYLPNEYQFIPGIFGPSYMQPR